MALKKGDKVTWNTSQGETKGTVQSRHTKKFEFKGQTFKASQDDPVYVVESKKSGSQAAHHESALTLAGKTLKSKKSTSKNSKSGKNQGAQVKDTTSKSSKAKQSQKAEKATGKGAQAQGTGGEHRPTKSVQVAAQRAVKWIEQGKAGKGFTDTGKHRAYELAERKVVDDKVVKKMRAYFKRHTVDSSAEGFNYRDKGYPSPGRVAWDAWGGNPGKKWAESRTIKGD